MLCIVVAGEVNMPALRMAANLVSRRIAAAVGRAHAELPPPTFEAPPQRPAPEALAAPASAAPAPPAANAVPGRRFRGRTVD
jgi:hypothetical protein